MAGPAAGSSQESQESQKSFWRPSEPAIRGWRGGRGFRQGNHESERWNRRQPRNQREFGDCPPRGCAETNVVFRSAKERPFAERKATNRILCGLCFLLLHCLDCPTIRAIREIRGFPPFASPCATTTYNYFVKNRPVGDFSGNIWPARASILIGM